MSDADSPVKRPRGRPRKNPIVLVSATEEQPAPAISIDASAASLIRYLFRDVSWLHRASEPRNAWESVQLLAKALYMVTPQYDGAYSTMDRETGLLVKQLRWAADSKNMARVGELTLELEFRRSGRRRRLAEVKATVRPTLAEPIDAQTIKLIDHLYVATGEPNTSTAYCFAYTVWCLHCQAADGNLIAEDKSTAAPTLYRLLTSLNSARIAKNWWPFVRTVAALHAHAKLSESEFADDSIERATASNVVDLAQARLSRGSSEAN